MKIKLKKLHKDAKIPTYAHESDACLDLFAIEDVVFHIFHPNDVKFIRSGLSFEIPEGHYVEIVPRSGLACKKQLIILNSPCIIDESYRGELVTYMKNLNGSNVIIRKGDRYAQMMLKKKIEVEFEEVDELSNTKRGGGGFGSTGK